MKYFAIIALGTLVFLSSDGRAQNDELFSESQASSLHALPLNSEDFTEAFSLETQSPPNGSPFHDLIQRGRQGGFSPQGDHLGDLLKTRPRAPSGDGRLTLTRGDTFYIPETNPHEDGN